MNRLYFLVKGYADRSQISNQRESIEVTLRKWLEVIL